MDERITIEDRFETLEGFQEWITNLAFAHLLMQRREELLSPQRISAIQRTQRINNKLRDVRDQQNNGRRAY